MGNIESNGRTVVQSAPAKKKWKEDDLKDSDSEEDSRPEKDSNQSHSKTIKTSSSSASAGKRKIQSPSAPVRAPRNAATFAKGIALLNDDSSEDEGAKKTKIKNKSKEGLGAGSSRLPVDEVEEDSVTEDEVSRRGLILEAILHLHLLTSNPFFSPLSSPTFQSKLSGKLELLQRLRIAIPAS